MLLLETFGTLLRDPNHWAFEILGMVVFDGLIGAVAWPFIKRHIHQDVGQAETHDHELIAELRGQVEDLALDLDDLKFSSLMYWVSALLLGWSE